MTGKIGQKLWFNVVNTETGEVTTFTGTLIGKSILGDVERSVFQVGTLSFDGISTVPDDQVYPSEKLALDARAGLVPPPPPAP